MRKKWKCTTYMDFAPWCKLCVESRAEDDYAEVDFKLKAKAREIALEEKVKDIEKDTEKLEKSIRLRRRWWLGPTRTRGC